MFYSSVCNCYCICQNYISLVTVGNVVQDWDTVESGTRTDGGGREGDRGEGGRRWGREQEGGKGV